MALGASRLVLSINIGEHPQRYNVIINLQDGKVIFSNFWPVSDVILSPNDRYLLLQRDSHMTLFDTMQLPVRMELKPFRAAAFSSDSAILALSEASPYHVISLLDLRRLDMDFTTNVVFVAEEIMFVDNGHRLVVSSSKLLQIWFVQDGTLQWSSRELGIVNLTLSADGYTLVSWDSSLATLTLWQLKEKGFEYCKEIKLAEQPKDTCISPNGAYVSVKQGDRYQIWSINTGLIIDLQMEEGDVWEGLTWSLDSLVLVGYHAENSQILGWDANTGVLQLRAEAICTTCENVQKDCRPTLIRLRGEYLAAARSSCNGVLVYNTVSKVMQELNVPHPARLIDWVEAGSVMVIYDAEMELSIWQVCSSTCLAKLGLYTPLTLVTCKDGFTISTNRGSRGKEWTI